MPLGSANSRTDLKSVDSTWRRVPGGTRYENAITIGPTLPRSLAFVQRAIRSVAFDEAHARAWLLHNVEEVGNFEHFLPALYAAEG